MNTVLDKQEEPNIEEEVPIVVGPLNPVANPDDSNDKIEPEIAAGAHADHQDNKTLNDKALQKIQGDEEAKKAKTAAKSSVGFL